jgi:uncharacterized protein YyaL (SSP411 family)
VKRLAFVLLLGACRPSVGNPPPEFRFSPRPNRAAEIHWRGWGPQAFAEAAAQKRPILLSLSAVWCHWCHVLDETTLSDPQVIALVNHDFIPVRVDADQHPDVERRYILGGWPTVAFLTARGEIVDGGTYVPPAQFLAMAAGVRAAVRAGGSELAARMARYRREPEPAAPGAVDDTVVESIARGLASAADLQFGGFGRAPKFPHGDAVVLLLDLGETDLARRALDGMLKLEDPVEGGFYRYATAVDWTHPHYEKMLAGNAELLAAYARGFARLHDPRYRDAALRIVAYVRRTLYDAASGTLYASQDADEAYAALDGPGRRARAAPLVDRTLLVDRAGRMIVALVEAARDLGDASLTELAGQAARRLASMRDRDGRFFHAQRPGAPAELRGQLGDQAWGALALAATGEPAAARAVLDATRRTLAAPDGACYDADATPLLSTRDRPLVENSILARALITVGDRDWARRILTNFAATAPAYGTEAAPYALSVRSLSN